MKTFSFKKHTVDYSKGEIIFSYILDNVCFDETINFPPNTDDITANQKQALEHTLFAMHLACGLSYWKTECPQNIIIESGTLDKNQSEFWEQLYKEGLGQFYYENNLDPNKYAPSFTTSCSSSKTTSLTSNNKSLLCWGGGKDSIVSGELLESISHPFDIVTIGDSIPQTNTIDKINKNRIIIKRTLSPLLKEINNNGAYNGHIPITAILAFIEIFVAILYGYDNVILSNEKSADEGNIKWKGINVNHQYSKSFQCEKDIQNYVHSYITPSVNYFSLLRGWYEIRIIKEFTQNKYKKYFPIFASCNNNFKQDPKERLSQTLWCCDCPKCAYVFLMFSPFLKENEMLNIFGENLFNKTSLQETFLELIGEKNFKPFECVGTTEECRYALSECIKQNKFLKSTFINKVKKEKYILETDFINLLKFNKNHNIPEKFRILFSY